MREYAVTMQHPVQQFQQGLVRVEAMGPAEAITLAFYEARNWPNPVWRCAQHEFNITVTPL